MEMKKAFRLLMQQADELSKLRTLPPDKQQYKLWFHEVSNILELTFGETSREYDNFVKAVRSDYPVSTEEERREKYNKELDAYEIALDSALHKCALIVDETPKDKSEQPPTIIVSPPKAFIAHEGETPALNKLKSFLETLGIKCLIAEIEPSDGRLVEPQIDGTQEQADFAIIFATKGKIINKITGKSQMGTNVADELGRARKVFGNKMILLLQKGVEPHSNVSGIVHERFTPQSMDKAFTKVVKELRNWDFLIVTK